MAQWTVDGEGGAVEGHAPSGPDRPGAGLDDGGPDHGVAAGRLCVLRILDTTRSRLPGGGPRPRRAAGQSATSPWSTAAAPSV